MRKLSVSVLRSPAVAATVLMFLFSCNEEQQQKAPAGARKKVIETVEGDFFSRAAFTADLQKMLPAADTLDSVFRKRGIVPGNAKSITYMLNGYQPLWLEERGVTAAAAQFISELDSMRWDGLNPERYNQQGLAAMMNRLKTGKADIKDIIAFDTACTGSYLHASRDLLMGVISPKTADDQWFHTNDTIWNAARQLAGGFYRDGVYPSLDKYRSALPAYALLRNEYKRYQALSGDENLQAFKLSVTGKESADKVAVAIIQKEVPWLQPDATDSMEYKSGLIKDFQYYTGLQPTGKTDSITARYLKRLPDSSLQLLAANMERMRWLPREIEDQYVWVNVPLMELYYKKDGGNAFHMKVVVGKPSRQTPALNAMMSNVVFSPPWGVPPTILKKEVLPGIAQKGGAYLTRKGLKAYNSSGKQVSVAGMSTASLRGLTFRQPPGARSALGEVKFNLPNKWDIYLHDTPHKEDFPRRYRAKSSGCIRVERPKDFAAFILNDLEGRHFTQGAMDSIIETRRTRFENLSKKIPVHIVYLTATDDSTGQHIRFLPDIYHRDEKLIMALKN